MPSTAVPLKPHVVVVNSMSQSNDSNDLANRIFICINQYGLLMLTSQQLLGDALNVLGCHRTILLVLVSSHSEMFTEYDCFYDN